MGSSYLPCDRSITQACAACRTTQQAQQHTAFTHTGRLVCFLVPRFWELLRFRNRGWLDYRRVNVCWSDVDRARKHGLDEFVQAEPSKYDHADFFRSLQSLTLDYRLNDAFTCLVSDHCLKGLFSEWNGK